MKIVFVIKALAPPGGGAERVLATVASGLANRGHDVTVITSDEVGAATYYTLGSDVQLLQLGIGDVTSSSRISEVCNRILALRKKLRGLRPDVVIAFMHPTYIPVGLAMIGSSISVIASEHTASTHYRKRPLQRLLLQLTPLISASITVVSEQVRLSFGRWTRRRMVVVPNPVAISPTSKSKYPTDGAKKTLLAVGRLGPEKQHSILIAAFARIAADFPDWTLRIVGEGELRPRLAAQIETEGLENCVELAGMKRDVHAEYAAADLFVVPSRYESFGMAVAEALLHGLPAVGFSNCPGTNELIRDGDNGKLVSALDQTHALASELSGLMGNSTERRRLATSSRDWIKNLYGVESVLDQWESVIASVKA